MSTPWETTEEAALARRLLRSTDSGILSTLSVEIPGYPFGSVTPYALTQEGRVAVYVSEIAQHTANMRADARVCMTVLQGGEDNPQAAGRITVVGDARQLSGSEEHAAAERYFTFFPAAREYSGTHDFRVFAIEPKRVRYIGGFGRIFWVEPSDWSVPTPDWSPNEAGIIDHMNADHADALLAIARRHSHREYETATLLAVDAEGFHVHADDRLAYVPFSRPCMTSDEVRAGMIELLAQARAGE